MIKLIRGVPSLEEEVVVCKKGEKLTAEKARLLSLLGVMMAVSRRCGHYTRGSNHLTGSGSYPPTQTFQVHLGGRWSEAEGFVEGTELDSEVVGDEDAGSDAEMA
jgi:mRNA turnover protein 4